jgi:hypothetical protein
MANRLRNIHESVVGEGRDLVPAVQSESVHWSSKAQHGLVTIRTV